MSRHFDHIAKWLDKISKIRLFSIFYDITTWLTNNCPISREVKAMRQWNLVSKQKLTWETFFLKNHSPNVVEKIIPDSFLNNQNWAYVWINILKFYIVCFYCMSSWELSKYIYSKLQASYFNFKLSFFK